MTEGKKTFLSLEPSFMAERIHEGVSLKESFIGDPYLVYLLTALVRTIPAPVFETVSSWLAK